MALNQKNQDLKQNTGRSGAQTDAPVQLTKEEMRQKIRASLAARNEAEQAAQQKSEPVPAYAAASSGKGGSASATSLNPANMNKARQIRESMESQRSASSGSAAKHSQLQSSPKRPTPPPPSVSFRPAGVRPAARRDPVSLKKIFLIVGIVLILILALFYFGGMAFYSGKYLPNTIVNGINVSGMTRDEAEATVVASADDMGVTFVTKDGEKITFNGASFGCESSVPDDAFDQIEESHAVWFSKLFTTSEYVVTLDQTYSEDDLASLIAAYDWGNIPPTDASIEEDENGNFYIQKEDDGNMVDTEVLSDYTLEQVRNGATTIDMVSSGCYMKAAVTAASLQDVLSLYEQYGTVEITFDMTNREELFDPVGTVVLDHETYMDWITFDDDGTLSLDKEAAAQWVQENIADPYDTFCSDGYTRTFDSTADGPVQVTLTPTSTYGWRTDVEATADMIEQYLRDGESITTEPEWVQAGFRPYTSDGTVFEEGTYIEIDISEQHLWFYVNGELYLDTDVVTGLASDPSRITNTGIFKIRAKYRDVVLGTYEVQGYEAPVSYWMPIDHTGIGLHDLYRSAYGGDIYLTNGSHGCINLPLDMAAKIYEKTVIGMPVVIVD